MLLSFIMPDRGQARDHAQNSLSALVTVTTNKTSSIALAELKCNAGKLIVGIDNNSYVAAGRGTRCQKAAATEAVMIQINTKIAAGMAASSPKWAKARVVPKPAFCMPISIDRARLRRIGIRNKAPTP
jgi:hypothetical protein